METFVIGLVLIIVLVFFIVGLARAFDGGNTFLSILLLFVPPFFLIWVAALGALSVSSFVLSRMEKAGTAQQ